VGARDADADCVTLGARRAVATLMTISAFGCAGLSGSAVNQSADRHLPSTATVFPPVCQDLPRDPARDARAKACGARDDVRHYVRDARATILSAWSPPAADDSGSVLLSFQVAEDGTLHDVCTLDDFESPLAPSALEAVQHVNQLPKPDAPIAACLSGARLSAMFQVSVTTP
jgi:hypothetical protein